MISYLGLSCDIFQISVPAPPMTTPKISPRYRRRKQVCFSTLLKCRHFKFGAIFCMGSKSSSPSAKISIRAARSKIKTNGSVTSPQAGTEKEEVSLLWFKHDLRTDDHPGLVAASQYTTVLPVYVFDQSICSRLSNQMLQMLVEAVKSLKQSLKDHGSDLIIRHGRTEDVLLELVKEAKVTHIITEEEGEYDWLKLVHSVSESVSTVHVSDESPRVIFWKAHLFEFENWKDVSDSYRDFQKIKCSAVEPLSCPTLPGLQLEVDRGVLPEIKELRENMKAASSCHFKGSWGSIKFMSASSILEAAQLDVDLKGKNQTSQTFKEQLAQEKQLVLSSHEDANKMAVGGGTSAALNALDGYLRYLESTWRDDWQEIHERLQQTETRRGASFRAIFGCALSLGTISRRRVYHESLKYERLRNAGQLPPVGLFAFPTAAAVENAKSMEWYWFLALKSQEQGRKKGWFVRTWRWRGYLIQYTSVGDEGPAVVLVHGFGVFWEHYRDNTFGIAKSGHRVWAITLLGFGRSEKPNIVYTELLWAELLRDFIVDVVGEPAHVVGNSVGGYLVSLVARLWPALVRSLVLCDPAGMVIPNYSSARYIKPNPNSAISWLGARFLLLYLRTMAGRILKKYYPTNPARADDWLLAEILRASYDPDAVCVLESVVDLKLSLPLNYLLDSYNKNVLVIQGDKDPLYQSQLRATMLEQHCNAVIVRYVNAGHCPHDEIPDEVNSIIQDWVKQTETGTVSEATITEGSLVQEGIASQ